MEYVSSWSSRRLWNTSQLDSTNDMRLPRDSSLAAALKFNSTITPCECLIRHCAPPVTRLNNDFGFYRIAEEEEVSLRGQKVTWNTFRNELFGDTF